jgi:hypothetical protein
MSDDVRALASRLIAASRYAMPLTEARRQIEERRQRLLAVEVPAPDADFSAPEPFADPVDDPSGFAAAFWQRKARSDTPPACPPGRPPKGDLSPEHERFRVLDGGKEPHGDNDP